jgi:hypothetical protein
MAVENMSNACQLLLMRACARRAHCKKCHSRFFGRMFNDFNECSTFFLWPGAWQKLRYFLEADSPDSADSSINPGKTPRYGKSTVLHRKISIHRMSMIRARARPLRMHENFLFYENSIFNFVMSRCILYFLGQNTTIALWHINTIVHQTK